MLLFKSCSWAFVSNISNLFWFGCTFLTHLLYYRFTFKDAYNRKILSQLHLMLASCCILRLRETVQLVQTLTVLDIQLFTALL